LRACARIAGLAGLFLLYLPPHLASKMITGRSHWPRRFLAAAARIAGARVQLDGKPLAPRSLVIANHISWLDILILGGATGTAFVSKAEVGKVPLIGWLADQNHTLYIERSERGDAHGQVKRIADRLGGAQPLAVFPEGTTGDGRALLPFNPTLLHAVAPPPPGVEVRPVAVHYGEDVHAVAWHGGEHGVANVLRVLGMAGTRRVTVLLLEPLPPSGDRKHLARAAHAAIRDALPSTPPPDTLNAATK
jgi:1-acyl-sn-glycerol-3-phosphate acyltransferase